MYFFENSGFQRTKFPVLLWASWFSSTVLQTHLVFSQISWTLGCLIPTCISSSIFGSNIPLPIPRSLSTVWVNLLCSFQSSHSEETIPMEQQSHVRKKTKILILTSLRLMTEANREKNTKDNKKDNNLIWTKDIVYLSDRNNKEWNSKLIVYLYFYIVHSCGKDPEVSPRMNDPVWRTPPWWRHKCWDRRSDALRGKPSLYHRIWRELKTNQKSSIMCA